MGLPCPVFGAPPFYLAVPWRVSFVVTALFPSALRRGGWASLLQCTRYHVVLAVKGLSRHKRCPLRASPIYSTVPLTAALRRGAPVPGNVALQPGPLMKNILDIPAIKTAFRTAGALMVGNAFVAPFLFNNRDWMSIVYLLAVGICFIILTSLKGD